MTNENGNDNKNNSNNKNGNNENNKEDNDNNNEWFLDVAREFGLKLDLVKTIYVTGK